MFNLDLGNLLIHLGLNTTAFNQPLNAAYAKVQHVTAKMEALGGKLERSLTLPLTAIGTYGLHAFAKFDQAMTRSLAIFGNVSADMRDEMEKTAREMALHSEYSAVELAKAYFYIGSAGYNAEQALNLLGVAERFATAGSFDLSAAVTMCADAQKALGMQQADSVKNAEALTRITDVLVGANTLANANTQQFAEALTNEAGPAMKAWGVQLEEGVAVLAAYADQGTKGATAGSDFSRMLRFLMQGFRENNEAWLTFGINIYDAIGNLRPLADVIEDLSVRLDGMSARTKGIQLDLLGFQARSQQVILPLLGTQDAIRGYLTRLKEMQALTAELAERNMKNFGSRMTEVWHVMQTLASSIGRILAPYIERLGEVVRRAHAAWESLNDSTKLFVVQFGIALALIGPAIVLFAKLVSTLGFMVIGFTALKTAAWGTIGAFTALFAPLLGVIAGITAMGVAVYALRAAWLQNLEVVKGLMEDFVNGVNAGWEWLTKVTGKFLSWFTKGFIDAYAYLRSNTGKFFADIISSAGAATVWISKIAEAVKNAWRAPDIASMVSEWKSGAKSAGDAWAQAFTDSWDKSYADVKKFSAEAYDLSTAYAAMFRDATVETLSEWRRALSTQIGADAQAMIDAINSKIKKMTENNLELLPAEDVAELQAKLDDMQKSMAVSTESSDVMSQTMEDMLTSLEQEGKAIEWINRGYERGAEIVAFKREAMKAYAGDLDKVNEAVAEYAKLTKNLEAKNQFEALYNWMNENDYAHLWKNLADDAAQGLDDLAATLTDFMVGQEVDWKEFCASLLRDFLETIVKMQQQKIIAGLASAVGSALGKVGAGAAKSAGTTTTPNAATAQFDYQVGSAMGNAFERGRVVAMSMGGVLPTPTIAAMSGHGLAVMAERAPEAVMPLARTSSGRLGVFTDNSRRMTVNKLKVVNVFSREEQLAAMRSDEGEKVFMNFLKRNGVINGL